MVDRFLNHLLLLLLLFHLLSQDSSLFFRASNQIGAGLQYIFYVSFKPDLISSFLLYQNPQSIPVYMLNNYPKRGIQAVPCIPLKDILFLYAFKSFKFVGS